MADESSDFNELFEENARTAPQLDSRSYAHIGALLTEGNHEITQVQVAYETWGVLNEDRSNAILVCHALSGDSNCVSWWDRLVGPGKAIDTNRYFVICSNVLGGCQGTTGPNSPFPRAAGTAQEPSREVRFGSRFPLITIGDMVEVQARLVTHLGIDQLLAVAGGSMGGMQALEWSVRFPDRVRKVFCTASARAHSAMQIGFNETARQAILRDPEWHGGDYDWSNGPANGLAVARMIGHLTFLSESSFERKFSRRFQNKEATGPGLEAEFEVESYLNYQGNKFTNRFDAGSLVTLTKAIDHYELNSLRPATAEFVFVSYTSDWIYPSHQSAELHQLAQSEGKKSTHYDFDLAFGHDAFLLDGQKQGGPLRWLLEK